MRIRASGEVMRAIQSIGQDVESYCAQLYGEQVHGWTDDDGTRHFDTLHRGVPVGVVVEPWGEDDSIVVAYHLIGAGIDDMSRATRFVMDHNQRVRVGRFVMTGDAVAFTCQVHSSGLTKDSLRFLLQTAAGAAATYPELAEDTGALRLADLAVLRALTDEDDEDTLPPEYHPG
jgi:hypothetical protein